MAAMDYRGGKAMLAPMVRVGTLPMRLLALEYGADIVYGEELVDFRVLQSRRVENELLQTVDYLDPAGRIVFRTCAAERGRVVFQVGTADAQRALQVAKLVERDVAAFDVNMGCPKSFSIMGGMGAALLSQPDKIREILTTLVAGVSIPVTCKIRLLPTVAETVALAKLIESTGVAALAIHARFIPERPRDAPHYEHIRAVVEALSIPVIANGGSLDVATRDDIDTFIKETRADSAMIARSAQDNVSVFRREGRLPLDEVVRDYIRKSIIVDNTVDNGKYVIQQMLLGNGEGAKSDDHMRAPDWRTIASMWSMEAAYLEITAERERRREMLAAAKRERDAEEALRGAKRARPDSEDAVFERNLRVNHSSFDLRLSPKMVLHSHSLKNKQPAPVYETKQDPETRLFRSVVVFNNRRYATSNWYISKKLCEQASAIICMVEQGIPIEYREAQY